MESFSVPALTALKSADAIAIRQIVSSLIQAIEMLRKDVEIMKASVAQQQKQQNEKYGVRR